MRKPAWSLAAARAAGAFAFWVALSTAVRADDAGNRPSLVGTPTRLEVFPPAVKLSGPRSRMQLVVTGHYADGSVRDLTRDSQFASTASEVATIEGSLLLPHQNGTAEIAVIAGGRAAVVSAEVIGYE